MQTEDNEKVLRIKENEIIDLTANEDSSRINFLKITVLPSGRNQEYLRKVLRLGLKGTSKTSKKACQH